MRPARRVHEELGFTVPLSKTTVIDYKADVGGGLTENERVHVFKGEADQTTLKTSLNPEEVAAVRWVEVADLPRLLAEQPDSLCPWFAIYIRRWNELNLGL
jgi:isopentenyl-diphosphate delta-isomerase